jgi:hypothetical protein
MSDDCQREVILKNDPDYFLYMQGEFGPGKCINIDADIDFDSKKEEAKTDFDKACDLYRSYVGTSERQEERLRRINKFRCG